VEGGREVEKKKQKRSYIAFKEKCWYWLSGIEKFTIRYLEVGDL